VREVTGGVDVNYLRGEWTDEALARIDPGGTTCYLVDILGSSVALADSNGTIVTEYTYESFGQTLRSGSTSENTIEFTGREDDGTGLYHYRTRYYEPRLARFLQEDLMGIRGGLNLYSYVDNNPQRSGDPFGLQSTWRTYESPLGVPGGPNTTPPNGGWNAIRSIWELFRPVAGMLNFGAFQQEARRLVEEKRKAFGCDEWVLLETCYDARLPWRTIEVTVGKRLPGPGGPDRNLVCWEGFLQGTGCCLPPNIPRRDLGLGLPPPSRTPQMGPVPGPRRAKGEVP
jgi:RHS repeat-associated protein